jgi:hypothetical protein
MRKLLLLIFFLSLNVVVFSQEVENDSIEFSLLTCNPGNEIYSLFGHTAIRYQNFKANEDLVYNYGMFSFRAPNFIYRFIKGETDYELGVIPYRYFEAEYALRGSSVYQQTLNLTYQEKKKLKALLDENYLPENRVYRYNYFYDNCTTRARDMIEKTINGDVTYEYDDSKNTFRSIVHEYTKGHEWDELGIDLCLGAEADKRITKREETFSPFYLMSRLDKASASGNGKVRPLVRSGRYIINVEPVESGNGFPLSPLACALILLLLNIVVVWQEARLSRIFWGWDIVMFALQGIGGCIVSFLFFFSLHPTVDTNWMILVFNPIPLLYLPFMINKDLKRKKDLYHYINVVYLTLFILIMPFIAQKFNLTVLPLTASLLVCSLGHILYYRKKVNERTFFIFTFSGYSFRWSAGSKCIQWSAASCCWHYRGSVEDGLY